MVDADSFIRKHLQGKSLYHFTDTRNLPSIRAAGGLLSLRELTLRNISVPAAGGNQWSQDSARRFGLDEYVSLCFFSDHPMEYLAKKDERIVESVFLRINPEVLKADGIKISLGVSNKSGVEILTLDQAVDQMDFEVMYQRTDWRDPAVQERLRSVKKYEILVPQTVPLKFIAEF